MSLLQYPVGRLLHYVTAHPLVAWAMVAHRTAYCADITGQLKDGRRLEIALTESDGALIDRVNRAGGKAFVARSFNDIARELPRQ